MKFENYINWLSGNLVSVKSLLYQYKKEGVILTRNRWSKYWDNKLKQIGKVFNISSKKNGKIETEVFDEFLSSINYGLQF